MLIEHWKQLKQSTSEKLFKEIRWNLPCFKIWFFPMFLWLNCIQSIKTSQQKLGTYWTTYTSLSDLLFQWDFCDTYNSNDMPTKVFPYCFLYCLLPQMQKISSKKFSSKTICHSNIKESEKTRIIILGTK